MSNGTDQGVMKSKELRRGAVVKDRLAYLEEACAGHDVLHVGCVDSGSIDTKVATNRFLHARLAGVASLLYGVDIDEAGVGKMQQFGYRNLYVCDVEKPIPLDRKFDVIVAGEVMEHLGCPMAFLETVKELMADGGRLLITVPNAFSIAGFVKVLLGTEIVHRDHVSYFSPATIECLLHRGGFLVSNMSFCSDISTASGWKLFRKRLFNDLLISRRVGLAEVIIVTAQLKSN